MNLFKSLIQKAVRQRTHVVVSRVTPYLKKSDKILDIGSGTGDVAFMLQQSGYNITPVDVADFHGIRLLETTIYDGKTLPFTNQSFDKAMLLMVMHHTPNPEAVFKEAARVAKEIIVIETSFSSRVMKPHTVISDAIGNLRLEAYWDSYKPDSEWRKIFSNNGFMVADFNQYQDHNFGLPFLHLGYYLKRN